MNETGRHRRRRRGFGQPAGSGAVGIKKSVAAGGLYGTGAVHNRGRAVHQCRERVGLTERTPHPGHRLEVFGLFGLEQQYTLGADATGRDDTGGPLIPAEWLATFSTARALEGKLRMRVGMGGALPTGTGSDVTAPALRTVASVSFTP